MTDKGTRKLVPPGLTYIAENITSKDNILGIDKGTGSRWAKDLNLPREADVIFFAGCGYQYTGELESLMSVLRRMDKSAVGSDLAMNLAGFQKRLGIDAAGIYRKVMSRGSDADAQPLRDAVKVLSGLGLKIGYLAEKEPCCGGLLHYAGLHKEFAGHAQQVHDRLKSLGVRQIIGLVPSCTYTLRQLIADSIDGYDLEVRHFCQTVSENISSLKLRFPKKVKVTYHDPCQLVRYLGLVEEPRQILNAIEDIELVETEWTNREWATCCGGGGGFEAVFPELSHILAVNRVKELVATGADIIATNCPGCIMQLRAGLKDLKASGVEVLDLAQIVAMAMEV